MNQSNSCVRPTAKAGTISGAAAVDRLVDDPFQVGDRVRRVEAVAVGAFDQEDVGFRDRLRVAEDRVAVPAEVAGEDDPHRVRLADGQIDRRRPEDVAGVPKRRLHVAGDRETPCRTGAARPA